MVPLIEQAKSSEEKIEFAECHHLIQNCVRGGATTVLLGGACEMVEIPSMVFEPARNEDRARPIPGNRSDTYVVEIEPLCATVRGEADVVRVRVAVQP
ncbi:hypothetical protein NKCBBBOE_00654 [Pseudarthrobacter sp. MM222]|nr:hypothetical protein NKCBBBOE_00654 [Pseudarthrobacter sp. MM222]